MNPCKQGEFLILDGATGSNLIAAGMPAGVCVEQWILENPSVLQTLQRNFAAAGSDVVLAPTFGANPAKLRSYGLTNQTKALNGDLVALSRAGIGSAAVIAGDVSPTGLFLAPFGTATFDELTAIYDEQMAALQAAGVDLVMIETQMTLADARAALLCAKKYGLTAFVTITVEPSGRTLSGLQLACAVVTLQAMGADAVGLNCSCGPQSMADLLKAAAPYAKVPLIAKPNAGEPGNPLPPEEFGKTAAALADCGASIVGGCCGTTPDHIAGLIQALAGKKPAVLQSNEEYLADERTIYPLPPAPKTETFPCGEDLIDDLPEVAEDTDLVILTLENPEEADDLTDALSLCRHPVCFESDRTDALAAALKQYQGRAVVKGDGVTTELCQTFGCLTLS